LLIVGGGTVPVTVKLMTPELCPSGLLTRALAGFFDPRHWRHWAPRSFAAVRGEVGP
jgi:hypothetical protein